MSSRFYPSLAAAAWAGLPAPEWLPGAGESTWQQTIVSLNHLWEDVGEMGALVVGSQRWLARQTQMRPTPPASGLQKTENFEPEPTWLFTADFSLNNLSRLGQIVIPVLPSDALLGEQFVLLLTPAFGVVAVWGEHPDTERPGVMFSFEPQVVQRAWGALQLRLQQVRPDVLDHWESLPQRFPWRSPDYRVLSRFGRLLLAGGQPALPKAPKPTAPELASPAVPAPKASAPELAHPPALPPQPHKRLAHTNPPTSPPASTAPRTEHPPKDPTNEDPLTETELLRAIAHEVRTPLTTIHTLTRLLLRRSDLPPGSRRYVEAIERECVEQIDRFGLFFRAAELKPEQVHLQPTSLASLLEQNRSRWQQQVERRGSTFALTMPADLPAVVSDPVALDAILTGLIDRIARNSPPGSQIKAQLVSAGAQVKLQFQVLVQGDGPAAPPPQALGQLLVVQPETGAISLSIPVTQTLFRAMGGYLTVRHQPARGETLTIYLPREDISCPDIPRLDQDG